MEDVERILLDIYGDVDRKELGPGSYAVRSVVSVILVVRPDLWSEDQDALELDLLLGIGIAEELRPILSSARRAYCAFWDLKHHICFARDNPEELTVHVSFHRVVGRELAPAEQPGFLRKRAPMAREQGGVDGLVETRAERTRVAGGSRSGRRRPAGPPV